MNITASRRSALFLAAGLWVCIAGPVHAQESDTRAADPAAATEAAPAKPIALDKFNKRHNSKKVAAKSRKSDRADKTASKAADKPADDKSAKADAGATMPPAVANANAQLPAETPTDMSGMAAQADSMQKWMGGRTDNAAMPPEDHAQVVAADELNEVDRALSDDKPALTLARATIDTPAVVVSQDNTAWDKTSLVGKIFIAFGGLLTLASAARMFIA